jgi:MerR family redox-sensitive transcriptional activator SoxR
VGQVALRSGIAVTALHFYEKRGLIASRRSSGNQRRYPRHVLRRLGVIKAAQQVGLSLGAIEEALGRLPDRRTPTDADWAALAAAWRAEIEDRMARLALLRDRLTGCIGCGCLSVKRCPLLNPDDAAARLGAGAHFLEPGVTCAAAAPSGARRRTPGGRPR